MIFSPRRNHARQDSDVTCCSQIKADLEKLNKVKPNAISDMETLNDGKGQLILKSVPARLSFFAKRKPSME